MLSLLASALGIGEIVLIVACVAIVAGVLTSVIIRKKKGKSACCSECNGGCPHCVANSNQQQDESNK